MDNTIMVPKKNRGSIEWERISSSDILIFEEVGKEIFFHTRQRIRTSLSNPKFRAIHTEVSNKGFEAFKENMQDLKMHSIRMEENRWLHLTPYLLNVRDATNGILQLEFSTPKEKGDDEVVYNRIPTKINTRGNLQYLEDNMRKYIFSYEHGYTSDKKANLHGVVGFKTRGDTLQFTRADDVSWIYQRLGRLFMYIRRENFVEALGFGPETNQIKGEVKNVINFINQFRLDPSTELHIVDNHSALDPRYVSSIIQRPSGMITAYYGISGQCRVTHNPEQFMAAVLENK